MAYVPEEKHVKFVAYKLKGAATWWDLLQIIRRRQDKLLVMIWQCMKQLLQSRFLPPDYQHILYNQFEQCRQGTRIVVVYAEEFYHLSSRCDLSLTEQQTSKYINILKYFIQERMAIQDAFSVEEHRIKQ